MQNSTGQPGINITLPDNLGKGMNECHGMESITRMILVYDITYTMHSIILWYHSDLIYCHT